MLHARARATSSRRAALILASAAGILGVLYAGVSAYWGAGGTALLDTIGGALEREGRLRAAALLAVVWITVMLKLAVSGLGLIAVGKPEWLSARQCRLARGAAWLAAIMLTHYGGVLTVIGLLVQAKIVPASAHADHTALRWHAFLWDPWFLLWGLSLPTALAMTRRAFIDRLSRQPES
jgi:hypothetical protein